MMTPEDILIESIAAASRYGDSVPLRIMQCDKLALSLKIYGTIFATEVVVTPKATDEPKDG